MKKLLLVLMLVLGLQSFASTVAVVDMGNIFKNYSQAKKIQKYLGDQRAKLLAPVNKKGKALEEKGRALYAKGDNVTKGDEKEYKKLQKDYQKELGEFKKKFGAIERKKMQKLENKIKIAITEVAKSKKMDVVVNKAATLYGGEDITKDVLKFLENSKSVDL